MIGTSLESEAIGTGAWGGAYQLISCASQFSLSGPKTEEMTAPQFLVGHGVLPALAKGNAHWVDETFHLHQWLETCEFRSEWPAAEIIETLERILEDRIITPKKRKDLQTLLERTFS